MAGGMIWTNSFHHTFICSPELRPLDHVMIAGIMDAADFTFTAVARMSEDPHSSD
jgi:hypothetical protein